MTFLIFGILVPVGVILAIALPFFLYFKSHNERILISDILALIGAFSAFAFLSNEISPWYNDDPLGMGMIMIIGACFSVVSFAFRVLATRNPIRYFDIYLWITFMALMFRQVQGNLYKYLLGGIILVPMIHLLSDYNKIKKTHYSTNSIKVK